MNLESVRELKQTLTVRMLPQIETAIFARAAFRRAAGPVARAVEPPRTVALGVARKGKKDFQLAVRVQQRGLEASTEVDRITRQARGEVDLRYIGRVNKRTIPWHQKRQRPLLIGCSVGHFKITAGTLGCFVRRRDGGSICMLSNTRIGKGYGLKINLQKAPAGKLPLPATIKGVPVLVEVVGPLKKRLAV